MRGRHSELRLDSAIAALAPRIAPIIARLSTPHDGEKLACVAALGRLLGAKGLDFTDLGDAVAAGLAPSRVTDRAEYGRDDDHASVEAALASAALTDWEYRFLTSLRLTLMRGRTLTPKQRETLRGIVAQRCAA